MRDYPKIQAWQLADDLAVMIYEHTGQFPRHELYGVTSQIRRTCVSVPTNIWEGSARESKKDYLHFLYISRASLSEVQYLAHLAHRLGYLPDAAAAQCEQSVSRVFQRLHGLIKAVEKEAGVFAKVMARMSSVLAIVCLQTALRQT